MGAAVTPRAGSDQTLGGGTTGDASNELGNSVIAAGTHAAGAAAVAIVTAFATTTAQLAHAEIIRS